MQRIIAKYGLAAHLALAAAAPLFLFPFFGTLVVSKVVLWLALYAAVWTLMEPSIRSGEHLHDARKRVIKSIVHDPLFWTLSAIALLAGLQWFNDGIQMAYDAENQVWSLASPFFPILPGSVSGQGDLAFALSVMLMVILAACRHALGKSARMVFLFVASLLSGLAAVVVVFAASQGHAESIAAMSCSSPARSYIGATFGVYLMASTVALVFGVERQWLRAVPAFLLAIGGSAVGLVAFAPAYVILVFLAAELVVVGYAFLFSLFVLKGGSEFKFFCFFVLALGFCVLLVQMAVVHRIFNQRLAAVMAQDLFPVGFEHTRAVLSDIAFRVWKEHLWIGTGLGSFPFDIRFYATAADWRAIPPGTLVVPNGGWQILAERGIVGAVQLAVPFVFLMFAYVRRLIVELRNRHVPHPACVVAPLAALAIAVISIVDCTLMRMDFMLALCAVFALSANSFHKEKK